MFCYQCEQTSKGTGCTSAGVCGKDERVAALQDVLTHVTKGLAQVAAAAQALGIRDPQSYVAILEGLFTTVTNVNFDAERMVQVIRRTTAHRDQLRHRLPNAVWSGPAAFQPAENLESLAAQAAGVGLEARRQKFGADVAGLQELALYGLKGAAAYADHAHVLGQDNESVFAGFRQLLGELADEPTDPNVLLNICLRVGDLNLKAMELLEKANTGAYGHPEPTRVRVTPRQGKAILVSGHDLKDLEALLQQTQGLGIQIYTHGEMLPAHGYPELKKYPHLAGNYGGAWQDQRKEFDAFPGAILMTTNCIQRPAESYQARIFTSGLVAWPGVTHIANRDFSPVIQAAQASPGFAQDGPDQFITVGFGRQTLLNAAGQIVAAVKSGQIKHFYLIGGCDGARSGRNYYTEAALNTPKDSVILTLACGKYRFNKLEFGEVAGFPRLLDIGQCNDAYAAIQVAVALAKAFGTDVNGLPLTFILSWYEQKAVAILLTLLNLNVKGIRLGPSLPAFVTPTVLGILQEKFGIKAIGDPKQDVLAPASVV